jgi:hypothetical protein
MKTCEIGLTCLIKLFATVCYPAIITDSLLCEPFFTFPLAPIAVPLSLPPPPLAFGNDQVL